MLCQIVTTPLHTFSCKYHKYHNHFCYFVDPFIEYTTRQDGEIFRVFYFCTARRILDVIIILLQTVAFLVVCFFSLMFFTRSVWFMVDICSLTIGQCIAHQLTDQNKIFLLFIKTTLHITMILSLKRLIIILYGCIVTSTIA